MQYGIMARTGLGEPEALEVAVKIVAAPKTTKEKIKMDELDISTLFQGLDEDQVREVLATMQGKAKELKQPDITQGDDQLEANARKLKQMYKEPTRYRSQIRNLEAENAELWSKRDQAEREAQGQAKAGNVPQIQSLEAELITLAAEARTLSKFPSRNRDRLRELSQQIETKSKQLEALK
jgi:predicted  nucleic acid-binding Zn-ribbon protein